MRRGQVTVGGEIVRPDAQRRAIGVLDPAVGGKRRRFTAQGHFDGLLGVKPRIAQRVVARVQSLVGDRMRVRRRGQRPGVARAKAGHRSA